MHSSQAGLASFKPGARIAWDEATLVVTLNSAAFELRLSRDGHWYVIGCHKTKAANAQAMVGLGFKPGDNPNAWPQGYALAIQRQLNKELV